MGGKKGKQRQAQTTTTTVSKQYKQFEKAMHKADNKNQAKEQEEIALEEEKLEEEEILRFGPPLYHRIMRKVRDSQIPRPRSRKTSIEGREEADAKIAAEEVKGQAVEEGTERLVGAATIPVAEGDLALEPIIFKVMSYNVMAERLLDERASHLAPDSICRSSAYRQKRILAELENSNSDIICLQEVSYSDGMYQFLADELERM